MNYLNVKIGQQIMLESPSLSNRIYCTDDSRVININITGVDAKGIII